MHGAVEHHGRGHSSQPQGADEGGGLPVAMRHRGAAAMCAHSPAALPGHLGGRAGLVDEDQPVGVETGLGFEAGPPAAQHVYALLLAGVRGFF